MTVEVYSKESCGYCVRAKALLDSREIEYEVINAPDHRDELINRVSAIIGNERITLPQIFIDGDYIGGYDQLVIHFKNLDQA